MSDIVYLNGDFLPRQEAVISPDDRGFNFADGVYEVIKYYKGNPFRMDDHLERLERSLREVRIHYPGTQDLPGILKELLEINGLNGSDAGVYIQVTRGTHRRVHHFPENIQPTVYLSAFPFGSFTEWLENGIGVITREDIRWMRCDIKSVSLLPNTMLYDEARQNGAGECFLIRDGHVTEATHSTVFGVKNGKLFTHPLSNLILPGITRKVILEMCILHGIPFEEEPIPESMLADMDELFIAGTGSEVTPVVSVNGKMIGDGKPGQMTRRIQGEFFGYFE